MRLLAVGDLHLGRTPRRLPEDLADRAGELGPVAAWRRIVDAALTTPVQAVVLAGDVVEGEWDFFEAYRELASGLQQLIDARVEVLAVAGNHDVRVLPRLADQVAGFRLLGRHGRWETWTLQSGAERLTLHGWSFAAPSVRSSPIAGHRFQRGPGPNLGLLHCDRDQAGSTYAPVTTSELESADLDGWLLGHIHAPDAISATHPCGYLGSATGLDPGEAGARGPWLITIEGGRIAAVEHWALAPLRWERLAVDLTGIGAAEDARDRLLYLAHELDPVLSKGASAPLAVGLRVSFGGRTAMRSAVQTLLANEDLSSLYVGHGDVRYFVERIDYAVAPELEMADLASRADPAGLLARRLCILERSPDDADRQALIRSARRRLEGRAAKPCWLPLGEALAEDEAVADWLRRAGLAALDRLLAQRETAE